MIRKLTFMLPVLFFSGCATFTEYAGVVPGNYDALPIEYKEAIKSGILLAHPELTPEQATDEAEEWYNRNANSVYNAIYGLTQRPEYTQAENAFYLARMVYGLIQLSRGLDVEED